MKKALFFWGLICWGVAGIAQSIAGYWQGSLHFTATDSLALGCVIAFEGDSLVVTLDSPDQYVTDIPTSQSQWQDSAFTWKASQISASFSGKLSADGRRIEGTFKQGAAKVPLVLMRGYERIVIHRPQTPTPPYPYSEEEIRIRDASGKFDLIAGTLTMPTHTPKAIIVLITGSGWQDRDETIFGHHPFAVIADFLTRQDYAVFRYDDYPVSLFAKSTTYDFADGVTLIIDSLKKRNDLCNIPLGLLGHSEGSLIAEIVSARDKRISFVITLGGVAQRITDVLLYQTRAINLVGGDFTEQELDNTVALSNAIYQTLLKTKNRQQAAKVIEKFWDQQYERLTPEERERYHYTQADKLRTIQQLCTPWFYAFLHLNPKSYIKKMRCPVLAIGGEKDLQVDAVSNNQLFAQYLPHNPKHQFLTIPQANHLLQTCETGSPSEYGKIEETISPKVLKLILDWLEQL